MPETYLAFDYGERRIGVAVGQRITGTATALEVIRNGANGFDWHRIDDLLGAWAPSGLVVGVPLTEDGEEQTMTKAARRFAGKLADRARLPTHHADERFTSMDADEHFRNLRRAGAAKRKGGVRQDAFAAKLILERWFAAS